MNRSLQILIALLIPLTFHSLATAQSGSLTTVKLSTPCKTDNAKSDLTSTPLRVEFEGLDGSNQRYLLTTLCDKGVFSGAEIFDATRLESTLKEMLLSTGYPYAQVRISFDQQSLLSVFVDKGVRLHLTEIQFEGNKFVSNQQLLPIVRGCLKRTGEGDTFIYNADMVEYCGRLLSNGLSSFGYLQARVGRKTEVANVGYKVSFSIEEGQRYRLGKVRIKGSEALTEDQIKEKLQLREGQIASGGQIAKWLFEDLKKVYGDIGFIEYTAEIIPTFQEEKGIVDLDVDIDEGKKFTLRSITFTGHALEDLVLQSLLLVRVGDAYNDTLFRQSIERLNGLGLFAHIDPDRDVDFKSDQENALVAVTIKLKKP